MECTKKTSSHYKVMMVCDLLLAIRHLIEDKILERRILNPKTPRMISFSYFLESEVILRAFEE